MSLDPSDASNVYMFMSRNRKIVKILHYERGFYVLYEKRPVMGRFKKPVFDEVSKCYRIQWSDMAYLTESIVVDKMYVSPKVEMFEVGVWGHRFDLMYCRCINIKSIFCVSDLS